MKPPKCRLCGAEHWLRDPHVFAAGPDRGDGRRGEASRAVPEPSLSSASNTVAASNEASNTKQRWDRDKYNAYQRDYMRKRRCPTA